MMEPWFTVEEIDAETWAISEYGHWEEPHCYLLAGSRRSLLIDAGLGLRPLRGIVRSLTALPVTAIPTHAHWDHIGGLAEFPDFYVHAAEAAWLQGAFPLPPEAVRQELARGGALPPGFAADDYAVFQGRPAGLLRGGEVLDLGGRKIQALHTPGHSPGHLCFWEAKRGFLFTGDLIYAGELAAFFPTTDPAAYLASLEQTAALPVRRLLPGHHSLALKPALLTQVRDAFRALDAAGLLRRGSGVFSFGDWSVRL